MVLYADFSRWSPSEMALNCRAIDEPDGPGLRAAILRLGKVTRVYSGDGGRFSLRFPNALESAVRRTIKLYK
jgi:hypothetical protein